MPLTIHPKSHSFKSRQLVLAPRSSRPLSCWMAQRSCSRRKVVGTIRWRIYSHRLVCPIRNNILCRRRILFIDHRAPQSTPNVLFAPRLAKNMDISAPWKKIQKVKANSATMTKIQEMGLIPQ